MYSMVLFVLYSVCYSYGIRHAWVRNRTYCSRKKKKKKKKKTSIVLGGDALNPWYGGNRVMHCSAITAMNDHCTPVWPGGMALDSCEGGRAFEPPQPRQSFIFPLTSAVLHPTCPYHVVLASHITWIKIRMDHLNKKKKKNLQTP